MLGAVEHVGGSSVDGHRARVCGRVGDLASVHHDGLETGLRLLCITIRLRLSQHSYYINCRTCFKGEITSGVNPDLSG